jgi:hypothetical protein
LLEDIVVYVDRGGLSHQAYYVATSTADVPGNEANDGLTTATPVRTFLRAMQRAVAAGKTEGAVIYVKGRYRTENDGTVTNNNRWIWIKPWPGLDRSTSIWEAATSGAYCQIKRLRISTYWDGRNIPGGGQWASIVTNQANYEVWIDDYERDSNGYSLVGDSGTPNGFSKIYLTDGYDHDCGLEIGGNQWQVMGNLIRNVYCRDHMGDVPHAVPFATNFSIRRQLQTGEYSENPTFTADATANTITLSVVPTTTGVWGVYVTNSGGALPGGLTAGRSGAPSYYIKFSESPNFKVYPTSTDATNGTNAIDLTSAGTGTHTLHFWADVHADIFQNLGNNAADNVVIINMLADEHYVVLNYSFTGTFAWINCGFFTNTAIVSSSGMGVGFDDALLLHTTFKEQNFAWNATSANNTAVHANSFVSVTGSSNPVAQADWTNNNFLTGTTQGSSPTTGAIADGGAGQAVYAFDVLGNRRGLYSVNHVTRPGVFAAASEYTGSPTPTPTPTPAGLVYMFRAGNVVYGSHT